MIDDFDAYAAAIGMSPTDLEELLEEEARLEAEGSLADTDTDTDTARRAA